MAKVAVVLDVGAIFRGQASSVTRRFRQQVLYCARSEWGLLVMPIRGTFSCTR